MNNIKLYTYQKKQSEIKPLNIDEITRTEVIEKIDWDNLKPSSLIGIVVGSRGINNIKTIVKSIVELIKAKGHQPIIIPAMGSHGGGTAEGQLYVLNTLGIISEEMGCAIESSVDTKVIGNIDGIPIHMDTVALRCQGLILINRIKAHTSFTGVIESGLLKMAVIGLGNPVGAMLIHSFGPKGLQRLIPAIGNYLLNKIPIILGLALVEDQRKEISIIKGLKPKEIFIEEQKLLIEAKNRMAKLPVKKLDILIIEEMGKCYSGTGIDTNVIGRLRIKDMPEPPDPDIERIIILDIAEASSGNATGVGLADFVTKKLVDKIDWDVTYRNVITTTFTQRAMLPIVMKNEKEALEAAINSLGKKNIEDLRIMKINNTLNLNQIKVSENIINEFENSSDYIATESSEVLYF